MNVSGMEPKVRTKIRGLRIILDLTVVLNFAIDGVWINSLDDFGERFREKSVSQLL